MHPWDGTEQFLRVGVIGRVDNLVSVTRLDNLAGLHHGDAVADVADDGHVVADEEVGEVEFVLQVLEQVDDLGLDADVEGAGGLVADDEAGLEGEGSGDGDALTLAA